ncbi:MAG: P-loop NTPase fold protein [Pseudomonadota bacterium]
MEMLTDNPIAKKNYDKFGFAPYAGILADTIRDTDSLPFCIGIFAEWGAGKSSLMNMIRDDLQNNNNNNIKTIWFNPWKYDRKEDLWNALIQTILFNIIEDSTDNTLSEKAKELAKSTAWLLFKKGLGAVSAGIISEQNIEDLTQKIVKQDELHFRHINHFEENFRKVVDQYTDNGKLVVFIDDLDRCLPENAITVLESLKLFIGDARCVFVLGMDHIVVEQGLNIRFSEKIKMSGRDYLDKIIQVPFFLPPVPFTKLKTALQVSKATDFDDQIWKLVEFGLGGNPRKTKRFVNSSYLVNQIMHNREFMEIADTQNNNNNYMEPHHQKFYLAKLLIFQMVFLDYYLFLKQHPESWFLYVENLIKADSLEGRKKAFESLPAIEKYWNDERLRQFMEKTHGGEFPPTPKETEIYPLIQAISLVSGSERSEKSSNQ